jgi:Glycosyl transferase family 2
MLRDMPSLSIVVEWENAKHSDFQRGRAMLCSLIEQLRNLSSQLPAPPELILVYDADEGDPEGSMDGLGDVTAGFPGTVTVAPCHGLDYYEQKNFGAQLAKNEAILFLDCDVVPRRGWLQNLLDCYVQEGADVVGGATHMDKRSTYEKAFAAFWFFPLASEVHKRRAASRFFANNVIIRAELFRSTPFPNSLLIRGQCALLADKLLADHRSIYLEPGAVVTHPPPNGLAHFAKRALCAGHDKVALRMDQRHWAGMLFRLPAAAVVRFWLEATAAAKRIILHRREAGLSSFEMVGAMGVAVSYIWFQFVGETISIINPRFVRKHFRV